MKYLVAIAGTLCLLAGAIQAQTTYTTQVYNAINTGLANLNTAYVKVNTSITTADQSILTGWKSWQNSTLALYNMYYNRFKAYTTVDLSTLTSAISSLQSTPSSPPMLISGDGQVSSAMKQVMENVKQTVMVLVGAVQNITTTTGPKVASCNTTYAPKLMAAPITVSRFADCVSAEQTRVANIGLDVSAQYSNMVNNAVNYLSVVNVCDIPTAAALNTSSTSMSSMPPSNQCMTKFLQSVSSPGYTYYPDTMRMAQTQVVYFRMTRCAKLVQADIQDLVSQLLTTYTKCVRG